MSQRMPVVQKVPAAVKSFFAARLACRGVSISIVRAGELGIVSARMLRADAPEGILDAQ